MFNGLSREKADAALKPYAPALLQFVEAIYADKAGQDDGARSWLLPGRVGSSARLPGAAGRGRPALQACAAAQEAGWSGAWGRYVPTI